MPYPACPITSYWYSITFGEVGYKTDISQGYGGKEWRDSVVSVPRRTFGLPLKRLSIDELKLLWDHYNAMKGAYGAFTISVRDETGNDSATFNVRFTKDGMTYEWIQKAWHSSGVLQVIEI